MIFDLQKLSKKEQILLAIISLIALVFYLLRLNSGIFLLSDSEEYLATSIMIQDGSYFYPFSENSLTLLATKRPFLYPVLLLLNSFLSIKTILFIQSLATIFSFYFIIQCLKKLNIPIKYNFVFFIVLTPSIFIYSTLIMTEWLCFLLISFLTFIALHEYSTKRFLYIQLITILLAATKPVFFPLVYLNFVFFTFYFLKKTTFSFFLFLPTVFLIFYLTFNNFRTGYTHYSSIENVNLIDYNLYYFKSNSHSKQVADVWRDSVYQESSKLTTFKEKSIFYKNLAKQEIKKNLISYSWYHFYTGLRGIFDPGRFDLMTFFKKENGKQGFLEILNSTNSISSIISIKTLWLYIILIPILLLNFAKFFLFGKYFFDNRKKLPLLTIYLFLLVFFYIFLTGPVNCSRLMTPIQGIIIIFSIAKLNEYKKYRNRV
jgi:hypothetical protein